MKKLLLVIIVLLLCGCQNTIDIKTQLDNAFATEQEPASRANNYTNYIEYYLAGDVNEESNDELSFGFSSYDCKFILNINVSNIINKEYYGNLTLVDEGFFDENKLIYERAGVIKNLNSETLNYVFKAYQYDNSCLMHLMSDEVNIYGSGAIDKGELLASKMLQLAKGNNVHNDKIIADFSSKDVIDYQKTTVNLFENIKPISGRVEDMKVKDGEVSE